jgi:hypothetical protein
MAHRVFISVRLCEDSDHAAAKLKEALRVAGVSAFVCDPLVGDDIAGDIARALDACELFVVLGTEGYGTQGDTWYSTREELQFAKDRRKPIFLIKRCDAFFADPLAQMCLQGNLLHTTWYPHTSMPKDLVADIRAKLEAARAGPQVARGDIAPPITAAQMCVCRFALVLSFPFG